MRRARSSTAFGNLDRLGRRDRDREKSSIGCRRVMVCIPTTSATYNPRAPAGRARATREAGRLKAAPWTDSADAFVTLHS